MEDKSVDDYLVQIKALIDVLASIGDPVPDQQHIDVILEGLPQDFASVISVIESKFDSVQLEEVEALLLAHEIRSNKYKKQLQMEVAASVNLTQANPQTETEVSNAKNTEQVVNSTFFSRGGRVVGRSGGRSRGRGRLNNIQCQVCFKYGHLVVNCYHRFNQQFQPHMPADFQSMNLQNFYNPFQPTGGPQFSQQVPNTWPRPSYQPRLAPLPTP